MTGQGVYEIFAQNLNYRPFCLHGIAFCFALPCLFTIFLFLSEDVALLIIRIFMATKRKPGAAFCSKFTIQMNSLYQKLAIIGNVVFG